MAAGGAAGPPAAKPTGRGPSAPSPLCALRAPAAPPVALLYLQTSPSRRNGTKTGPGAPGNAGPLVHSITSKKGGYIPMQRKADCIVSTVFYLLSLAFFLIVQLSVVGGTGISGTVLGYHYPLRLAVHCLAILSAIAAALWGKPSKKAAIGKLALSAAIILFLLIAGVPNNVMA